MPMVGKMFSTQICLKIVCFFLLFCELTRPFCWIKNFDDWLSSNFHRFVILCICWDTSSEKTGLWQLPIVSRVFKSTGHLFTWCIHAQNSKLVKIWTQLVVEVASSNRRKNTLITQSCVLSDAWFRELKLLFWGLKIKFKYFSGKITSFSKTTLLQRELFPTMFWTINSPPLLSTK